MAERSFDTTGVVRRAEPPVPGTAVVDQRQFSGKLVVSDQSVRFGDQEIPYSQIKTGVVQITYHLGFPRYTLVFTDGEYNYLFHVPRHEAESPLPVPFEVTGRKSWLRRYWFLMLVAGWTVLKMFVGHK